MKKFNVMLLASLLFGIASLSGCKKENQINKNLWKGDGTWNIDVSEFKSTSTHYDEDNYENYGTNTGTIKFNEDGTGIMTHAGSTSPITYTNTDKLLTIIFVDVDGTFDESDKFDFEIVWKKNSLELEYFKSVTYSDTPNGVTVNVTSTTLWKLKLSKN